MLLCSVLGVITLLWLARLPFHKPGVVLIGYGWSCIRGGVRGFCVPRLGGCWLFAWVCPIGVFTVWRARLHNHTQSVCLPVVCFTYGECGG